MYLKVRAKKKTQLTWYFICVQLEVNWIQTKFFFFWKKGIFCIFKGENWAETLIIFLIIFFEVFH